MARNKNSTNVVSTCVAQDIYFSLLEALILILTNNSALTVDAASVLTLPVPEWYRCHYAVPGRALRSKCTVALSQPAAARKALKDWTSGP